MFIVLLRFSENKAKAGELMDAHKSWIKQGFDDGIFLLVGSLKPSGGGGVLANNTTFEALETRVAEDPFIIENVVTAEILELDPARVNEQMQFLVEPQEA